MRYEWYQKHGTIFELCITDNAIFRTLELDDLILKNIGDISLSTEFIQQVGVEKVLLAVKKLYDRFGVKKIKYIDCGHPELFKPIIEWANQLELHNCVHHDFRTDHRELLHHAWAEYQNTWVTNAWIMECNLILLATQVLCRCLQEQVLKLFLFKRFSCDQENGYSENCCIKNEQESKIDFPG